MKTPHHPEPWEICKMEPWFIQMNHPGHMATIVSGGSYDVKHHPQRQANLERIVACVNACAGMEDPAAEIERLRRLANENTPQTC